MKRVLLIVAIGLVFTLAGCLSQEEYDTAIAEASSLRDTLASEGQRHNEITTALRTRLATATGSEREAILAQIEAHERLANQLTARADDLGTVLAKIEESGGDAGSTIEAIGQTILPFLPPGSQGLGVAILGIGGVLVRAFQRSQALKGVIGSIEKAKAESPEFAAAFVAAAPIIKKNQPPSVRSAVDAVQAQRLLPV